MVGRVGTMISQRPAATPRNEAVRIHNTTSECSRVDSSPMVDDVLKGSIYTQLTVLETIDIAAFDVSSVEEQRAFSTLLALKRLPAFCHDVFSRDDTNVIECFFSVLRRRTPIENTTLLDEFKALDFSEEVQLRKRDPSVPTLPHELKAVLDVFIPSDVQGVLTKRGVDGFISTIIET